MYSIYFFFIVKSSVIRYLPLVLSLPFLHTDKGGRGLDMHHDAAEVTVNICLGRDGFHGGDLLFCGRAGTTEHRSFQYSYKHVKVCMSVCVYVCMCVCVYVCMCVCM